MPLGGWGRAQSHPLGTAGAFGTLCCRWLGEGERGCRDRHARNATTQRKPLLGTFQPLNRIWHFLHLPPALGPGHVWESPKRSCSTSVYIHIRTSTSRDRDSSGLQRGPGARARGAQRGGLCHPALSTEGGREQVLKHGPDKAQASRCCCHAKQRLVEGMQPPQQPKSTNCVALDTPEPSAPQPSEQQGHGSLQPFGTAQFSSQWALPCWPLLLALHGAHATGRACWAFTWQEMTHGSNKEHYCALGTWTCWLRADKENVSRCPPHTSPTTASTGHGPSVSIPRAPGQ